MAGKIRRRKKRDSEFSTVYNNPFQREDMSAKAKGILIYLMTLPEDWTLYKTELTRHFTDGKDSLASGLEELEGKGYFVTIKYRKKGRFVYEYFFNDEPYTADEIDEIKKEYETETAPQKEPDRSGKPAAVTPQQFNSDGDPAYTKDLITKDTQTKDIKTKENLNHNQEIDLFILKLPMNLKQYFKNRVPVLVNDSFNIYDVEEFYNTSELIEPNCSKEDIEFINDFEFNRVVRAVYENGERPIRTTQGILKSWVLNYISFKRDYINGVTPYKPDNHFYNWLEN